MNVSVNKSRGEATLTSERTVNLIQSINELAAKLPKDTVRIEIDVEYADGGRVKLEGKA